MRQGCADVQRSQGVERSAPARHVGLAPSKASASSSRRNRMAQARASLVVAGRWRPAFAWAPGPPRHFCGHRLASVSWPRPPRGAGAPARSAVDCPRPQPDDPRDPDMSACPGPPRGRCRTRPPGTLGHRRQRRRFQAGGPRPDSSTQGQARHGRSVTRSSIAGSSHLDANLELRTRRGAWGGNRLHPARAVRAHLLGLATRPHIRRSRSVVWTAAPPPLERQENGETICLGATRLRRAAGYGERA